MFGMDVNNYRIINVNTIVYFYIKFFIIFLYKFLCNFKKKLYGYLIIFLFLYKIYCYKFLNKN